MVPLRSGSTLEQFSGKKLAFEEALKFSGMHRSR